MSIPKKEEKKPAQAPQKGKQTTQQPAGKSQQDAKSSSFFPKKK